MLDLNAFGYACNEKPMSFNMNENGGGNINKRFTTYLPEVNTKMLTKAFNESKGQVEVADDLKRGVVTVAAGVRCN